MCRVPTQSLCAPTRRFESAGRRTGASRNVISPGFRKRAHSRRSERQRRPRCPWAQPRRAGRSARPGRPDLPMSGMRQAELVGPFRDKVLAHKFRPVEMRARRTPAMAWSNSMSPIRRGHGDGYQGHDAADREQEGAGHPGESVRTSPMLRSVPSLRAGVVPLLRHASSRGDDIGQLRKERALDLLPHEAEGLVERSLPGCGGPGGTDG
jgi:hypothetical protein